MSQPEKMLMARSDTTMQNKIRNYKIQNNNGNESFVINDINARTKHDKTYFITILQNNNYFVYRRNVMLSTVERNRRHHCLMHTFNVIMISLI